MRHIFQYNEEVPCYIKSYDVVTKTYTIETIRDHVKGYVKVPNHPVVIKILKNACKSHKVLTLNFHMFSEGKLMFKFILKPRQTQNESEVLAENENAVTAVEETPAGTQVQQEAAQETPTAPKVFDVDPLCVRLSKTDEEFDKTVLKSLCNVIGDVIDTEEKYDLAVNLIQTDNQGFELGFSSELYAKATDEYKRKFWEDEVVAYCSNDIVAAAWSDADEDGKKAILARLGINLPTANEQTAEQDNSHVSTEQLAHRATEQAVSVRRQKQERLSTQRSQLGARQQQLNVQSASIRNEQQEQQARTVQRLSQAHTDDERQQIQQESQQEQAQLQEEMNNVQVQQQEVTSQIEHVETEIVNNQQEINVIQQNAATTTIGGRGKLKINLKWNTTDDVDLHVYDPSGNHIYYGDKEKQCQDVIGKLDVDANAGGPPYSHSPQENIFWDDKAPVGHYKVDVNLYNHRSGTSTIPFTVTIYPEKGEPKLYTKNLTFEKETAHIVEFDYDENGIHYNS